ncbi:MAG: ParM/StbA family protein [Firmicutes bacterium]|jgi:plasmid segregation protein ParM|nr:ParM/StbA family protein [Bacillota bacterium]
MVFKIGIDLGYGFVKGVDTIGSKLCFPSVVARGRKRQLTSLFGGAVKEYEVVLNGEAYAVGERALRGGDATRAFGEDRYEHFSSPVLLATALAILTKGSGQPVHVATGLPLSYYAVHGERFRDMILRMADARVEIPGLYEGTRRLNIGDATIYPQAAGALWSYLFDENGRMTDPAYVAQGGLVGVVDIGYKTTDYLLADLAGLEILEELSGTINMGMSDIFKEVQSEIQGETGHVVDLLKVEGGVLTGRLWFMGREIDVAAKSERLGKRVAETIADRLMLAWRDQRRFLRCLYVAGGGAATLAHYLETGDSPVQCIPDPQYANARGFVCAAAVKERRAMLAAVRGTTGHNSPVEKLA